MNGKNRVVCVGMRDLPEGERVALMCLQGLANRGGARIFLMHRPDWDAHWLNWYAYYEIEAEEANAETALQRRLKSAATGEAGGFVVWDENLRDTIPIAITIAGIRGLVATDAATAARFPHAPVVEDLRGRWQHKIEAYRWAVEHLLPQCARHAVGSLEVGEKAESFWSPAVDYLVGERAFVHNLCAHPERPEEAELWHRVASQMEREAFAVGWSVPPDIEATYVDACSRHHLVQLCSSAGTNLSFHQHIAAKEPLRQRHASEGDVRLEKAVYITFSQTDGDALHSMTNLQQGQWASPLRGSVPMGWWIAPRLSAGLGAALLEYYYRTATPNDYFVAGPSGAGYNYPSVYDGLDRFLALTKEHMRLCDTRTIWLINRVVKALPGGFVQHRTKAGDVPLPLKDGNLVEETKNKYGADWLDDDVAARYVRALPDCPGFFQGFEPVVGEEDRMIDGKPAVGVAGKPWVPTKVMVDSPEQGERDIEAYLQGKALPAFVSCTVNMCGPMNQKMFEKMLILAPRLEGKGYRIVRPDEFLLLRRQAG